MDRNNKSMGQAEQFDEKINTIKSQFSSALDDFKKYYVYFNKNPEVNEFQNYYANSKGQLQTMSRDLFLTTNSIDSYIEKLNISTLNISQQIEKEKTLNDELKDKLKNLKNTQNGSEILIDDSKSAYNVQYYKNREMTAGIFFLIFLVFKIYRPPVTK
jgi:predicted S18 family serine protease